MFVTRKLQFVFVLVSNNVFILRFALVLIYLIASVGGITSVSCRCGLCHVANHLYVYLAQALSKFSKNKCVSSEFPTKKFTVDNMNIMAVIVPPFVPPTGVVAVLMVWCNYFVVCIHLRAEWNYVSQTAGFARKLCVESSNICV